MSSTLSTVELPIRSLAQVIGESVADVKKKLNDFLSVSNLPQDSDQYLFIMSMKQKDVVNYIYVGYADVPLDTAKQKDVQIVKVTNHQFIKYVHEGDLLDALNDSVKGKLTSFMKEHNMKDDMSAVFALIQETATGYNCYIPYKQK